MVADDTAAFQRSAFVEFDFVVGNGCSFELLRHSGLYVAGSLANFQQTFVRSIVNGIGIDARVGFGLWSEDVLDRRLTHRPPPSGGSYGQ